MKTSLTLAPSRRLRPALPLLPALLLLLPLAGAWLTSQAPGAPRLWVWLLMAPLIEEIVFRAGLQETLLRRGQSAWAANLVTAACFTAAHVLLRGDALAWAVCVPALLLGCVYAQTRQLRWCVVLHAAMNGLWWLTIEFSGINLALMHWQ
jgi:membrane protease YdiL (CAAX protease family)